MRILLATNFSASAKNAHDLMRGAALESGSHIRVVTVIQHYAEFDLVLDVVEISDAEARRTEDSLELLARTMLRPGVTADHRVLIGHAASKIVDEARASGAELIVVGSRGRGPFATTFLGSVSAELVDRAPCPVLVVRGPYGSRILFAEDGSAGAHEARRFLRTRALFRNSRIEVLGVVDVSLPGTYGADLSATEAALLSYDKLVGEVREITQENVRRACAQLVEARYEATAKTREGGAATEIVSEARESAADLIVMGTRGHRGFTRFILGSVARAVLTQAPCSVLVVRPVTAHVPLPRESAESVPALR